MLDFGIAKIVSGEQENHRDNVNPAPPCDLAAGLQSDRTITTFGELNQPGVTGELKTRFGTIVGTPTYMSPEQCLGIPVDYRADIYSLAVITYELVAGQVPFQGATVVELLTQQIEAPVPSPHKFDAKISKPLAASIMRGLEKTPADRPVSAGTLAVLLRGVVEGEFAVLRNGKDTFQSYPSVFAPLWIAAFAPMILVEAAAVLLLSELSEAKMVADAWLVVGFYVIVLSSWFFCAQMFKAAAALMLLKVSSIGAFRPATTAVTRCLVKGFPDLVRTQIASLLDIRPASIWQNQLWPVAWALEGLRGKEAVKRSQQLSRTVPVISLTLLPRFYAPALVARALSASDDDTLKLWDLETGGELRTLTGHADAVNDYHKLFANFPQLLIGFFQGTSPPQLCAARVSPIVTNTTAKMIPKLPQRPDVLDCLHCLYGADFFGV